MDIHEYQAKELLSRYSASIFRAAAWPTAPSRRPTAPREIGGSKWVVKAQIHSGARGKAGGISICSTDDEDLRRRRSHARPQAGDAPDRPARQARVAALCRGGGRHRARRSISASCSTARPSAS